MGLKGNQKETHACLSWAKQEKRTSLCGGGQVLSWCPFLASFRFRRCAFFLGGEKKVQPGRFRVGTLLGRVVFHFIFQRETTRPNGRPKPHEGPTRRGVARLRLRAQRGLGVQGHSGGARRPATRGKALPGNGGKWRALFFLVCEERTW